MIGVFIILGLFVTIIKSNFNVGRVSDSVTRQYCLLNVGLRSANPTYITLVDRLLFSVKLAS